MVPDKWPQDILGDFVDDFTTIMQAYQKVREFTGWDEYAKRLDGPVRSKLAEVLSEFRRIGWYYSHISRHCEIIYAIPYRRSWQPDGVSLCDFCERTCDVRGDVDTGYVKYLRDKGREYQTPKRCWESN